MKNNNITIYTMISTIIILSLTILGLGISLGKHGEYKPDFDQKYNFWVTLFIDAIWLILLYNAGLFDKFMN